MRDVKRPHLNTNHCLAPGIFDFGLSNSKHLELLRHDLFIPNELLVGKQLYTLIALLLFFEKLKALQFFHLQKEVKLSHCLDSFFLPLYKTRERVFSDQGRIMQNKDKDKGESRNTDISWHIRNIFIFYYLRSQSFSNIIFSLSYLSQRIISL